MGKWTLERWLTIGAVVFTLGMNWQRVWSQDDDIARLKQFNEKTLPEQYVSRELYNVQQQHLSDAINRLTQQLEKFYELEKQTNEPSRVQRQRLFDK